MNEHDAEKRERADQLILLQKFLRAKEGGWERESEREGEREKEGEGERAFNSSAVNENGL